MDIVSRLIGRRPDGGLPEFRDAADGGTAISLFGDLRDALARRGEHDTEPASSIMGGNTSSIGEMLGLSWRNRVLGAVGVASLGVLCLFLSVWAIAFPRQFAKLYTLGSVMIMASSLCLVGPARQCRSMTAPERAASLVVYAVSMILTLYFATKADPSVLLSLIFVVIQICAGIYYGASYIPFLQSCLRATAGGVLPI